MFHFRFVSYKIGIDRYTQTASNRLAANGVLKQVWQKGLMSDNTQQFRYMSHEMCIRDRVDADVGGDDLASFPVHNVHDPTEIARFATSSSSATTAESSSPPCK